MSLHPRFARLTAEWPPRDGLPSLLFLHAPQALRLASLLPFDSALCTSPPVILTPDTARASCSLLKIFFSTHSTWTFWRTSGREIRHVFRLQACHRYMLDPAYVTKNFGRRLHVSASDPAYFASRPLSTFFFLHFGHGRTVGLKGVLERRHCFG